MLSKLTLPLATKLVVWLGASVIALAIVLAASLRWGWGNSVELAAAGQACDDRVAVLQAEAKAAGAAAALEYTRGFADAAQQVDEDFAERMSEINDEQADILRRYRQLLTAIPALPPDCGPGQARVDAFNQWE